MPKRLNEEDKKEEKVEDGYIQIFMANPPRLVAIPITRKAGKFEMPSKQAYRERLKPRRQAIHKNDSRIN